MVTDRGTNCDAEELAGIEQQECLAHALGPIDEVLRGRAGKACRFGRRLKELLRAASGLWQGWCDGTVSGAEYGRRGAELEGALTEHPAPRELSDPENQRLLDGPGRHHRRGDPVRFLDDPSIPPTSNAAGRAPRPAVIARKVSPCSRTGEGARAFGAFSGAIRTAVKRGRGAVEWLCGAFRGPEARAAPRRVEGAGPVRGSNELVAEMLINKDPPRDGPLINADFRGSENN
jgi:hypothetical protein